MLERKHKERDSSVRICIIYLLYCIFMLLFSLNYKLCNLFRISLDQYSRKNMKINTWNVEIERISRIKNNWCLEIFEILAFMVTLSWYSFLLGFHFDNIICPSFIKLPVCQNVNEIKRFVINISNYFIKYKLIHITY